MLARVLPVIWLIALLIAAVFVLVGKIESETVNRWVAFVGLLLLIYQQTRKVSPKFDLTVRKAVLWLANTATQWSLDVRVESQSMTDPGEALDEIRRALEKPGTTVTRDDPMSLRVKFHRLFDTKITVLDSDTGLVLQLSVLDADLGYRDSVKRLKSDLIPFIETVEQKFGASPGATRKYAIVAYLGNKNPFYQHAKRDLATENIDGFTIMAALDDRGSRLTISRDQVEVVTGSLATAREQMARVFGLAFSD